MNIDIIRSVTGDEQNFPVQSYSSLGHPSGIVKLADLRKKNPDKIMALSLNVYRCKFVGDLTTSNT